MIYVIVSVFVVIFTIWTLFWGGIDISFHDNDFTVEAQGWSDYTVDYEQIDSISYKENLFQNGNDRRTSMVWEISEIIFMEIISATPMHPATHM